MKEYLIKNQNCRAKNNRPLYTVNPSKSKGKMTKPLVFNGRVLGESQNMSQQLKQFIDVTVTQFSVKCSLLVKEIETLKKEFVAQIEGIPYAFMGEHVKNGNILPAIIGQNDPEKKIIFTHTKSVEEEKKHVKKYNNYSINSINSPVLERDKINLKQRNAKSKVLLLKDDNDTIEWDDKPIEGNEKSKEIDELILPKHSPKREHIVLASLEKKQKMKMTPKIKALCTVIESNVLSIEEKIKLKYMNKEMNTHIGTNMIFAKAEKFYEDKIKEEIDKVNSMSLPSRTSVMSLGFITKESEQELLNEENKSNYIFFDMIYNLTDASKNDKDNLSQLYTTITTKHNVSSIKEVMIDKVRNIKSIMSDKLHDSMDKFISLYENSELKAKPTKVQSLFVLCFDEICELFKYEISKRGKVRKYQSEIEKIKSLEKLSN